MQPNAIYPGTPEQGNNPIPPAQNHQSPIVAQEAMPSVNARGTSDQPMAVVQALSIRGVEYTMMTLSLWFAAISLIWILLSIINGESSFELLALPAAIMIVTVPIFGLLFLRLRKDELSNPDLRLDPSKRRLSQFTQIFAFAACLFNLIALVYEIMQKMGGHFGGSIGKIALDVLIVFVIAGGLLVYYWIDEHRLIRN